MFAVNPTTRRHGPRVWAKSISVNSPGSVSNRPRVTAAAKRRFPFPIAGRTSHLTALYLPRYCPQPEVPATESVSAPPRSHMPRLHHLQRVRPRRPPGTASTATGSTGARPSRQDAFPVQSAESTRQRPHDGSPPLPSDRLNLPSTCCSRSIRQGCPGHPGADGNYLARMPRAPTDQPTGCAWVQFGNSLSITVLTPLSNRGTASSNDDDRVLSSPP